MLLTTSGSVDREGAFIAASTGRTLQLGISDNSVVPVGIDMFETNNTFGSTYLNFRVNNADLVRMTGSFVGIGTTAPTASLHISGASSANLLRIDSPASSSILYVSGSGLIGFNQTSSLGAQATFKGVGGGPYVSEINTLTNGQYGFRTDGPVKSNGLYLYNSTGNIANSSGVSLIYFDASNNIGIGVSSSLSAKTTIRGTGTTSATTALRVENTNASASLVVLDNGYVGIGTSSAQYQLDLYGSYHQYQAQGQIARYDISSANANQNRGIWDFYTNAAVTPDFFGRFGFKFEGGTADSFKQFQVHVADSTTPKFVVDGSGRMGIGTITPSSKLYISGSTTEALLIASSSNGPALFVSGSGNVGINTTLSAYRLQIDASGSSNSSQPLALTSVDVNNRVGILFASSSISAGKQHRLFHRVNTSTVEWLLGASAGETATWRFLSRDDTNYGVNILAPFNGGTSYLNTGLSQSLFSLGAGSQTAQHINISSSGNVGIGTTTPSYRLDVSGSGNFTANLTVTGSTTLHNGQTTIQGAGATSATTAFIVRNSTPTNIITVLNNNVVGINRTPTASLDVAGTTRLSGSFNTAASGSILTVIGSGSTQPIFTVQGSQGELFSITDSLSGSLFSVNDISGLPILEVFSDNTTLIGDYQDPMLITTKKVTMTNSGSFVVYSLPTASYDTAFFDYSIKSGSNARAGQIMAIQSGSSVNFTETTTTDFGSTTAVSFTVLVSGSNMVLTGSASTGSWTIKTIVRGL